MKNDHLKNRSGFAALLTIVLIGASVLVMALNTSFLGIGDIDAGFINQKGAEVLNIADGCVDETLRRIRLNTSYTATNYMLTALNGTCDITVSTSGSDRIVTVKGVGESYNRRVVVNLTLSGNVITINSWEEG